MPPGVCMVERCVAAHIERQLRVDLLARNEKQRHRRSVDAEAGIAQRGRQRNLAGGHIDRAHLISVDADEAARRDRLRPVGGIDDARNYRRRHGSVVIRRKHGDARRSQHGDGSRPGQWARLCG